MEMRGDQWPPEKAFLCCFSPKLLLWIFLLVLHHSAEAISLKAELYTTESFELLRTTTYPHFVMFYAPWCGHCKRVQTIWDQFAKENHVKRRLKIAKVDCTSSTPICAAENIKAYPTFLLFHRRQKYTFRGNRELNDFSQFVNEIVINLKDGTVPHDVTFQTDKKEKIDDSQVLPKVLTGETFQIEVDDDYTFVDFFAPWCSHCIKLEPTWNKLADAMKYNKRLTVAKVDCTADPELCQMHKISGYPTLNLYKDGYLMSPYKQARSLAHLIGFVQSQLAMDKEKAEAKESEPSSNFSPPGDESVEIKLTEESYKGIMSKTPHLIYFHNSGPEFSNMDLLVFEQVQHRLRSKNYDVTVAVIDCSKTNIVCKELGINIYPSIVYFTSIAEYSQYYGRVDVDKLVDFVVEQKTKDSEAKKDEL